MKTNGWEAREALHSSSRRRTKRSYYPACCLTLHGGKNFECALDFGALVIPQPMSVRADGYHTRSEQDAFVLGRQPSSRVTKHPHCHYSGESLGRIVPDMFFEGQEPVEEDTSVTWTSLPLRYQKIVGSAT